MWGSALTDPDLENLSLEDWARWVRLGVYIKAHGKDGEIRFLDPYSGLLRLFQMGSVSDAIMTIKKFPHCTLGERSFTVSPGTNETVTLEIKFDNWFKYQGDFSSDRVRKFRDKKRHSETLQEEKRRRREEKRIFSPPTPQEVTAYAASIDFVLDGEQFCAHYDAAGWMRGKTKIRNWKACVWTWKKARHG